MNIALLFAILFATHVLGGMAAFGSGLLAVPLMVFCGFDLAESVAVVLTAGLAQSIQMALLTWRSANTRAVWHMVALVAPGLPVGFFLSGFLPAPILHALLGVVLAAVGVTYWIERPRKATTWIPPQYVLNSLLILGGIIHGAFGTGGAAITVFGRYTLPEKEAFRGSLSLMWVILNVPLLAAFAARGAIQGQVLTLALGAVPAVLAATWLGHRVAARMPQRHFSDLVATLVCIAAILTLMKIPG